jgi:hypothetical protein
VKLRENKNASRRKRDFAYVFSKRLKRKYRGGTHPNRLLSMYLGSAELKPRPHPRLELHHHRHCRVLRSKPFPPSIMNRIRSPSQTSPPQTSPPQTSPPLSSPLSLPPPLPFEATFKFGTNMAHQLAVIHQDKGKSKAVASPSSVQVLSEHPSIRKRKFTDIDDKDRGKVRCLMLTTTPSLCRHRLRTICNLDIGHIPTSTIPAGTIQMTEGEEDLPETWHCCDPPLSPDRLSSGRLWSGESLLKLSKKTIRRGWGYRRSRLSGEGTLGGTALPPSVIGFERESAGLLW